MHETFSNYRWNERWKRARQHVSFEHILILILTKSLVSFATIFQADSDPNDKNSIWPYETNKNNRTVITKPVSLSLERFVPSTLRFTYLNTILYSETVQTDQWLRNWWQESIITCFHSTIWRIDFFNDLIANKGPMMQSCVVVTL